MRANINDGTPTVTCSLEELPSHIVWADFRDMSFDSSHGPIDHTDPEQIERERETYVGFQFSRRPVAVFSIDGKEVQVTGQPVWTSPRYFLDSEVMDLPTFMELAERDLPGDLYHSLLRQLQFQRAEDWDGVLVIWLNREGGVWKQYRYEEGMVPLGPDQKPITVIKTIDGDKPLN